MATHEARVADFGKYKIHAIKLVRELSGLGLKDAKDVTESGGTFTARVDARALASIEDARTKGIRLVFDPPLGSAPEPPAPASSGSGRFAVRYLSGERKINAIKLVRELTRCGLKEAKDLVEQQGTIAFDQSASEARAIAARFEAIGSRVELVDDDGREVRTLDPGAALSRPARGYDDFGDLDF